MDQENVNILLIRRLMALTRKSEAVSRTTAVVRRNYIQHIDFQTPLKQSIDYRSTKELAPELLAAAFDKMDNLNPRRRAP